MKIKSKVKVVCDNNGGGGDDWAIGKKGIVIQVDDDYCEVRLYGLGYDTYQFGSYQLEEIS